MSVLYKLFHLIIIATLQIGSINIPILQLRRFRQNSIF